jgi:hypothetical protein
MAVLTSNPISGSWPAAHRNLKISEGQVLVAGRTQMPTGIRVIKTWNPTTKEFETQARPAIVRGATGEKVFRFGPSKLI